MPIKLSADTLDMAAAINATIEKRLRDHRQNNESLCVKFLNIIDERTGCLSINENR